MHHKPRADKKLFHEPALTASGHAVRRLNNAVASSSPVQDTDAHPHFFCVGLMQIQADPPSKDPYQMRFTDSVLVL